LDVLEDGEVQPAMQIAAIVTTIIAAVITDFFIVTTPKNKNNASLAILRFAINLAPQGLKFCPRDHQGGTSFYPSVSDELSSPPRIKALFRLPEVPREVSELRIASYQPAVE